ncbi:MAG: hypothetical protein R2819_03095 [Allomuricauda sp.]
MKFRKFVFGLLVATCSYSAFSQGLGRDYGSPIPNTQSAASGVESVMTELWLKSLGKPVNAYNESLIKGSPYFEDDFMQGEIFYNNEETPRRYYLRYNAFRDMIEVKGDEEKETEPSALLKSASISCILGGKKYRYTGFKDPKGMERMGYIIEEYKGEKLSLFSRKAKIYVKGKTPVNSLAQKIPPKFVDKIEYLVGNPDLSNLQYVPERKRKLVNFFSKKYKMDVSHILKDKAFDPKNVNDLIQLLH